MGHRRVYNRRAQAPTRDGVYVGRPTKWGNPHTMRGEEQREEAIAFFVGHLERHPSLVEAARRELRGRYLVCWCAPKPCHADVLALVADGMTPELAGAVVLGGESEDEAWTYMEHAHGIARP